MKITKTQLQKVIQEELRAELNEALALPSNVTRLLKMITQDAGDEKIAAQVADLQKKMSINLKVLLAATILDEFGIPHDEAALRTAMTKGAQQQAASNRVRPDQGNELDNFANDVGGQPRQGMPNYPKQVPFKS